jgi:lysozyme
MVLVGIDLSSHQPHTDFALIATAIDFAVTKVTEDDDYTNPHYRWQVDQPRLHDMPLGHYHFAQPTKGAPLLDQLAHFQAQLDLGPGERVALDLEEGEGDLSEWAYEWCRRVRERLARRPLLYTYPFFADQHNLHAPKLAEVCDLWYAWYPNSGKPDTAWPSVAPWGKATVWQYTADGRVPGIDTVVDLNLFDGTREQFRGLDGLGRIEPDNNKLRGWFNAHRRGA